MMEIKQGNEECSEPRIDWRSIKASMGKWWLNGRGKDAQELDTGKCVEGDPRPRQGQGCVGAQQA